MPPQRVQYGVVNRLVFITLISLQLGFPLSPVFAKKPAKLSPAVMAEAQSYSLSQHEKALLFEQDGSITHERYAAGMPPEERLKIYSGTKLYWCLATLAAVDDHLLNLDQPISEKLPTWAGLKGKEEVTLRQLLDFSAGLDPGFELHQDGLRNRDVAALRKPLVAPRGKSFIYGPSGLQVAHAALSEVLKAKQENATHYLERHVLKPMHLGPQRYVADASGNPLLAAGFMQSAREWLRLGHVILRDGDGIVPASLFREALKGSAANGAFGFGIWNNRAASHEGAREVDVEAMLHKKWQEQRWSNACLCKSAPTDLLACIGSHGQRLYVVPSLRLVIVRLANSESYNDAVFLRMLFAQ